MKLVKVVSVVLSVVLLLSGCGSKGNQIKYGFDKLTLEEFEEKLNAREEYYKGERLKNDDPEFNKKLYDLITGYRYGHYSDSSRINDKVVVKKHELVGYGWKDFNLNKYFPNTYYYNGIDSVYVQYKETNDIKSEDSEVTRFIIKKDDHEKSDFVFYYTDSLDLNKVVYHFTEESYQEMYNFLMETFGVDIVNDYVEAKRLAVDGNKYEASVGNITYSWKEDGSFITFIKEFNVSGNQGYVEEMIRESSVINPSKSEITKDLIDKGFELSFLELSGTLNREEVTLKDYRVKVFAEKNNMLDDKDRALGKRYMTLRLYGQMDGDVRSIYMDCEAYGALFYDVPWLNKYSIDPNGGDHGSIYFYQYDN